MANIRESILLGEAAQKLGVNEDNFLEIEFTNSERAMPLTEDSYTVDAYEQYFKEKDASEKYRLAFTITPFCTNVLFNLVTEPVINEGARNCSAITMESPYESETEDNPFYPYIGPGKPYQAYGTTFYSGYTARPVSAITREWLVRDTGPTHPSIYGQNKLTYHCGYDIFNNHYLRQKGFSFIGVCSTSFGPSSQWGQPSSKYFNTLGDYKRTRGQVNECISRINGYSSDNAPIINRAQISMHVYNRDMADSFFESISNNLVENNGWYGFINKKQIGIKNLSYKGNDIAVDRVINDKVAFQQIDMYPDRTLFSFKPKYNSDRKRYEANWDYCLTYPYTSTTDNYLVYNSEHDIQGISCEKRTTTDTLSGAPNTVLFETYVRHNLTVGDSISMTFVTLDGELRYNSSVRVVSVGEGSYDSEHFFSVELSEIFNELANISQPETEAPVTSLINNFNDIRIRRIDQGYECQYYVRKFKKLPNCNDSSMNKLAFSQNAFADQVAQIVFTQDIDTTGMRDYLGRPISEIFLTIIKRNAGHKEWYEDNNFADEKVEYSHCFGEVTSGFKLPVPTEEDDTEKYSMCKDYNVRRIHSIDTVAGNIPEEWIPSSPKALEYDITIDNNDEFFGDLVEYSPYRMQETVLEDVYHRFNTAQRETLNSKYSGFTYDEIAWDDYDGDVAPTADDFLSVNSFADYIGNGKTQGGASCEQYKNLPLNLFPEGYYYKAHYGVKIKDFEEEVNTGQHIRVNYNVVGRTGATWTIETDANYYFQAPMPSGSFPGSFVYLYKLQDGGYYTLETTGYCTGVSGAGYTTVEITFNDEPSGDISSEEYRLFKHNTEMPEYAFDLEDGSGRYVWRNVLSYSEMPTENELYDSQFTNGAHYFHKNIMFYCKRQNPDGVPFPQCMADFIMGSYKKDVSVAEYNSDFGEIKC